MAAQWLSGRELDLRSLGRGFDSYRVQLRSNHGQVVHTYVPLLLKAVNCSMTWYRSKDGDVLRLRRWLQTWRKVMADYRLGWLKKSPAGWLAVHRDQLRAQRSVTSMGELYLYLYIYCKLISCCSDDANKDFQNPNCTVDCMVWVDQEEQDYNHRPDGWHDISRCVPYNVLHLQRRLLAVLPVVNGTTKCVLPLHTFTHSPTTTSTTDCAYGT